MYRLSLQANVADITVDVLHAGGDDVFEHVVGVTARFEFDGYSLYESGGGVHASISLATATYHIACGGAQGRSQLNSSMRRSLDEFIEQHEYFRDDQPVRYAGKRPLMLDEITAPDMLHIIDPRDLPTQDYAPYIKYVHY